MKRVSEAETLDIAVEHGKLSVRMSSVETAISGLSAQFQTVINKIDTLQQPKPTNWTGILSVIISLLAVIGAFLAMWVNLRIRPLELEAEFTKANANRLEEKIKALDEKTMREFTWNWEARERRRDGKRMKQ